MQLLSANTIQKEKTKAEKEQLQRVKKLNISEIHLAKKLNDTKRLFESEQKRIEQELTEMEKEVSIKKAQLISEIEALERRRVKALQPIKQLQKEVESEKSLLLKEKQLYEQKTEDIQKQQDYLVERLEELADREAETKQKEKEVAEQQKKIDVAKEKLRLSTEKLSKKWTEYHTAVHEKNVLIGKQQKENEDIAKVNETIRIEQRRKQEELRQERRALKDMYIALEQAKKHIYGQKG